MDLFAYLDKREKELLKQLDKAEGKQIKEIQDQLNTINEIKDQNISKGV